MLLINPYRFAPSRIAVSDSDAEAYLQAVEAADGQQLEQAVADAIDSFVIGCKTDGIWSAIKASCILAGARTVSGALKPLAGTAPTNFNFVSGDYDRKTGLLSNGTTKRLNSNRADNADPQDSKHFAVFNTTLIIGNAKSYGGTGTSPQTNINYPSPHTNARVRNNTTLTMGGNSIGFKGIARETSLLIKGRSNSTNYQNTNLISSPPSSSTFGIYGRYNTASECNCRLSFYSIGEYLDLALLDSRVSTLMSDLAAAIP